jgi:hypothetical protein
VGRICGGSLPTSIPLFLHLLANALIKLISLSSLGPEKLYASTPSRMTRSFQFVILATMVEFDVESVPTPVLHVRVLCYMSRWEAQIKRLGK